MRIFTARGVARVFMLLGNTHQYFGGPFIICGKGGDVGSGRG